MAIAKKKPANLTEKKRRTSGPSGPSLTDEQRAARGIGRLTLRISQKAIDRITAAAERRGISRAALLEEYADTLR